MVRVSGKITDKRSYGGTAMITAIDSNILYDVLVDDSEFSSSSQDSLQEQSHQGSLLISPLVYSELLVYFLRKHGRETAVVKLKEFLHDLAIHISPFLEQDYIVAAEAWGKFSKRKEVECPHCGTANVFSCSQCKRQVFWRNHILTDFLIGAHAQNNADCLLTRDRGYYRKYFAVRII